MPKLGTTHTTRLTLPSSTPEDQAWVEIKTELLLSDMAALTGIEDTTQQAITMLSRLIAAWNFTDDTGNPVEPSSEWLGKLTADDFLYLSNWVNDNLAGNYKEALKTEEKKALSDSSTVAIATEQTSPPII